jgi:hypothetical protein
MLVDADDKLEAIEKYFNWWKKYLWN